MEDNKNPKGSGAKRRPRWGGAEGTALLSSIFGKDFLCFWFHFRSPFWLDFLPNLPILRIPFPRGLF